MALAIIFLFCFTILLLFFLKKQRTTRSVNWPAGPRGLPLIGNLYQFDSSNPHRYLWSLSKQYGALISLRLGFLRILVVSSANMAKMIMKTHDLQFCSRPVFLSSKKLSYNCLDLGFAPYDDYWREMRKICVVHLFNSIKAKQFRPIREEEVFRLNEKISKLAVASRPVNLSEMMICLTSTITCRLAFGKRYEDEGTERSRFHSLLNETQAMLGSFFFADYFPFLGWVDKLTGMSSRLEKNFKECDAFYQEIIDDHLDPKRSTADNEEDIIDVLLQLQKQRGFKFDLTWDHIKGVLMVVYFLILYFIYAYNPIASELDITNSPYIDRFAFSVNLQNVLTGGIDTSTTTVVWAMTYLMKNPGVMKRAQEEIRHVITNKDFVDEDEVQRLQYLRAVVKETMRLQPAVPLLMPRKTTEKCIIEGYEIPPKTIVYVNAWAIGRDPEAWDNPEEFDPDRFMGSSVDLKGQNFELIPFGAGRRICPGIFIGLANVELTLANLLFKFDWELPAGMEKEGLDFDVLPGIVVHKKNALWLTARNVR